MHVQELLRAQYEHKHERVRICLIPDYAQYLMKCFNKTVFESCRSRDLSSVTKLSDHMTVMGYNSIDYVIGSC